jgi:hypothetical protein
MKELNFGQWQDMESAPKDGTKVLVEIRGSEQGAAEVDMVRWARPERSAEPAWISADSDPAVPVIYSEAELEGWMPLPTPLPKLRSRRPASSRAEPGAQDEGEAGGSGI